MKYPYRSGISDLVVVHGTGWRAWLLRWLVSHSYIYGWIEPSDKALMVTIQTRRSWAARVLPWVAARLCR